MLQIEKIINAGNCELVLKWSDGKMQALSAYALQASCPCARCVEKTSSVDKNVKVLGFELKGNFGIKIRFSSGCQSGIYSLNLLRSWLKNF